MAERPGVLRVGDRVLFGGGEHQVVGLAGNAVRLLAVSGQAAVVAMPFLLAAPDFAIVGTGTAAAGLAPRLAPQGLLDVLPEHVARAARDWERHLIEVLTGVPPDAPDGAAPRPEFDLARPLAERERAKAAELTAAGVKASARTVRRMRYRYREQGLWGLVDARYAPAARPAGNVDPRVVAAAAAVIDAQAGTSTGTRGRVIRQVIDRLEAEHGPGVVPVPSRATFYRLLAVLSAGRHTFGSAVTRRQTAGRPGGVFTATIAARPGEQVQMDGTPLDVMAVMDDGVIGRPELVAAVDVATRTICAAVLRPVGAKAVDAALLLARMMVPEPMRPGWDQALAMSASRIPYRRLVSIDTRLELAAAKPVIVPDTVVIDHGKVFLSEVFLRAADTLGLSVQPAHEQTGSDKAVMERTFGSINTLFCQHVAGYTGRDVTRRGTDVADRAVWSLADLQELLDEWVICWQSRPHEGLRHPFTPDRAASPNEVYAALVAAAGYVPVALTGEDYIELLPAQWRSIGDGGIQIDYRTYNCAELAPYRRLSSGLAAREGRWEVHYDPYDLTRIWVRDHHRGGWITVPWTHLAMVTQPFADFTWRHARKIAAQRGVDDANETAVAVVLAGLLRRAGQGPDTQRTLARTRAASVLPGLRPALPAPERAAGPAALPEPQAAEPGTCEEGTSPEAEAVTVAGFGLFDPFGEQDGEDR
jgi:Mu transposase, C-terminal